MIFRNLIRTTLQARMSMRLSHLREMCVFAVVFWSYTALVAVADLNPLITLCGYAAFISTIFRKRVLPSRTSLFWIVINVAIVALFVHFLFAKRFASADAINLLIYLTMYLEWYKLYHREKAKDYGQLLVISFSQLLMVSVLTMAVWFALIFVGYMVLFTMALVALTTRKDYDLYERTAARMIAPPGKKEGEKIAPGDAELGALLSRDFLGTISFISLVTLLVLILLFLFIPRFAGEQFLSRLSGMSSGTRTTGFGEDIDFSRVARIQSDPTIIMRIQPVEKKLARERLTSVRVRGTAVDFFDGTGWHKSGAVTAGQAAYTLRGTAVEGLPQPSGSSLLVEHKIYLEPHANNYLFAFNYPYFFLFERPIGLRVDPESASLQITKPLEAPLLYKAYSWIDEEQRLAFALKHQKEVVSREQTDFLPRIPSARQRLATLYLQLPETFAIERFRELADEITKNATGAFDKASAIERYFHEHYAYTLTPDIQDPAHELEDFVFRSRAGHCEYFASAMAVMLRIIGIPARVTSGFYTNEWNDYEGYFIVREQNAHSWVEAWMDFSWVTFDPTPSQGLPALQRTDTILTHVAHFLDSVKFKWYRYVIDYSREDQMLLRRYLGTGLETLGNLVLPVQNLFEAVLKVGEDDSAGHLNTRMVALFIVCLGGLGVILALLLREEAKRHKKRRPAREWRQSREVVRFYARVLEALRRLGFQRAPGETPREFALWLASRSPDFSPLRRLTELYYSVRYDDARLSQDDADFVDTYSENVWQRARKKRRTAPFEN